MSEPLAENWERLDPAYATLLRWRGLTTAAGVTFAAAWIDYVLRPLVPLPQPWLVPALILILLIAAAFLFAPRRYRAWGYAETADELNIRSGLWVRTRTFVPLGRVQHIDISQGPLERRLGLATLVLHTAGTRGASVPLPGLTPSEAERMRNRIRERIRRESGSGRAS